MANARADWFTAGLDDAAEDFDPFDDVEDLGRPIDLQDRKAVLNARYAVTFRGEGNLANAGVVCPVKDSPDTTCNACPISDAAKRETAMSALCRIGREQEQILTELAVLRLRNAGTIE